MDPWLGAVCMFFTGAPGDPAQLVMPGRGQVDDDFALGCWLEHLEHLVADVEREFELGTGVALGRVFVVDRGPRGEFLGRPAEPCTLESNVDDALLVGAEDDVALQDARGVVQVDDRLLGAVDRLVGAVDDVVGHDEHRFASGVVYLRYRPQA